MLTRTTYQIEPTDVRALSTERMDEIISLLSAYILPEEAEMKGLRRVRGNSFERQDVTEMRRYVGILADRARQRAAEIDEECRQIDAGRPGDPEEEILMRRKAYAHLAGSIRETAMVAERIAEEFCSAFMACEA